MSIGLLTQLKFSSMKELQLNRLQTAIVLLVITLTGAILRFYNLDFQSLWYDELHSIIPTAPDAAIASIIEYCKTDQPPAFFIYLHFFFKVFGYSEYAGRAACAVIGILSIPAVYFLAKECNNSNTGLAAALFLAVNYFSIYYSQELRFYSFAFLFSTLSFLFMIRSWKYNLILDFILYSACTSILLYTHYFGMVIFASQVIIFIYLIIRYRPRIRFIVLGFIFGIVTAIFFAAWLPVILNDLTIGSFWIQKPKPIFFLEYYYGYFGKDIVVSTLFAFFLFLFFRNFKTNEAGKHSKVINFILTAAFILSILIPLLRSIVSVPILHIRYTIVSLPLLITMVAVGSEHIGSFKARYIMISIVVLSSIFNLFFLKKYYSKLTKQQFREAAEIVKTKNKTGIPVYATFTWHYSFYFRDTETIAPKTIPDLELAGVDRFWLLPVQIFSNEEMQNEIDKFSAFHVEERHTFKGTEAVLMVRNQE
jgi:mannosyltransferase